jgi:hypothetical protein
MLHKLKRIDMEAKELRIGSWVNYKTENIAQEIYSIQSDNTIRLKDSKGTNHGCYNMSYIDPIPLKEEWLIKFGFENLTMDKEFCDMEFELLHPLMSFHWDGRLSMGQNGNTIGLNVIKHIHQLQNLYFALTGEELTIKK